MRTPDPRRVGELWRITTFRLTVLYGLVFAVGVVALLGMVYLQSSVYLTRRVDGILNTEADALSRSAPQALAQRIEDAVTVNGRQTSVFAVFAPDGGWIAGNLAALPRGLVVGGRPLEIAPTAIFPAHARLIARRLPSGEELVVGRDVSQLREIRAIMSSALIWSGVVILLVGVACGIALSVGPLRRLRVLQDASEKIAGGDLKQRLPVGRGLDELDLFAATVNYMVGEVERLMWEVKGSTETIAHDLRTPLTRARAQLHRLQQGPGATPDDITRVVAEIDEVLDRFRAIMRISELEARERHAGFTPVDLAKILVQAADLYQPLAEEGRVRLTVDDAPAARVEADPKLLFEAVSNLVDNAIKFAGEGGKVRLALDLAAGAPRIVVQDDGPGIPVNERAAVLQRFYRAERNRLAPGSGLGLSIVSAIVRLHRFQLALEDAQPGLRAIITCQSGLEPRSR